MMMQAHRALLVVTLAVVVLCGIPEQVVADAMSKSKPGLSLEAVCITRMADETARWLSAMEMGSIIRILRQSKPYTEIRDIPWEYCITLTTEQGEIACYYNAASNLICFPPYTRALQLPAGSDDYILSLFGGHRASPKGATTSFEEPE